MLGAGAQPLYLAAGKGVEEYEEASLGQLQPAGEQSWGAHVEDRAEQAQS